MAFNYIFHGYFTDNGAIIRLSQCQWSNPEIYGQIKHMNPQELIIEPQQNQTQQCA